jgi:putative acetyltransferase
MMLFEEQLGLEAAIRRAITDAFGRADEANLVDSLRHNGALAISLVAEQAGTICGHAALSRLKSPAHALALGPVSVMKARQGLGFGSALVRRAIELARERGHEIIFVLGSPKYYERFGFAVEAATAFQCRYAGSHFMALHLTAAKVAPQAVIYAKAFDKLE